MRPNRDKELREAEKYIGSKNKIASRLVDKVGSCNLKPIGTPYQVILKSVIGQQLSTKAAASIESRVIQASSQGKSFPSPIQILKIHDVSLRECGLSYSKIGTLKRVAQAYQDKILSDEYLHSLDDETVVQSLCEIKGIGPWTSEMVLMFGLDRWDRFSAGDLGLRKAVEKWFKKDREDKEAILRYVKQFSPYRTILSWYLWASIDTNPW